MQMMGKAQLRRQLQQFSHSSYRPIGGGFPQRVSAKNIQCVQVRSCLKEETDAFDVVGGTSPVQRCRSTTIFHMNRGFGIQEGR
mmetsp:Transcript_932/g.2486  ORF Transcript_932/g.2486 Transcript_932/m.2486 type:complete len:84 (-) Transcript_932:427-678(-)